MKVFEEIDQNNFVLKDAEEKHKDFYKKENHCAFCGHELVIKTQKRINSSEVTERTHCPSCVQDLSDKNHKLN